MDALKKNTFGRFCNFCYYWVEGKDSEGKRRKKRISAVSEDSAVKKAEAGGLVGPFKVEAAPLDPPTERQLALAERKDFSVPEGCTKEDLGAMISRDIDFDGDIDPDPGIVQYAKDCEVCFSSFVGESGLLQCMISQLSLRDKAVLFAYAVSLSRSGERRFRDPRISEKVRAFEHFADLVASDPALKKSLEERGLNDFKNPNARSKVYKAVMSCL